MKTHPLTIRLIHWTSAVAMIITNAVAGIISIAGRLAMRVHPVIMRLIQWINAVTRVILIGPPWRLLRLRQARPRRSENSYRAMRMHPVAVRIFHWTNAVAMVVLIMSGWKIYNDEVLFGFLHFPEGIVLGVWAQHALQWHFAFMWVLMINGLVYLGYGLFSGRFRRLLWPIRPREVIAEVVKALTFRLSHDDLTHYNAVQKLLYAGIILVIAVQVISGLAIWKPVQFSSLVALFYDFQGARLAHFLGMTAICLFMIVHITLALLVPRTILAMLTGGPPVERTPAAASPAH
jgi:thiosulfate reductase cytochrome b subunit